jgi:hypothetical protein
MADALLHQADDIGHRKHHLTLQVLFGASRRNCCTARCWSIWYRFFIATLLFFGENFP